jgi:hypothetical protein
MIGSVSFSQRGPKEIHERRHKLWGFHSAVSEFISKENAKRTPAALEICKARKTRSDFSATVISLPGDESDISEKRIDYALGQLLTTRRFST